jgi:NADH-quinone oxidoreductase subunit J
MTVIQLLFYAFATMAVLSGFMVVISKNPVRSVLFLVFTFFATAGIWILLHAEFLALVLVLVYVGAVMTLFLFVVMMLSVHIDTLREGFVRYLPLGIIVIVLMAGLMIMVLNPERFGLAQVAEPIVQPANYSNLANLGDVLYTEYAYPFEIAAVILLTAIIAAISLSHRPPRKRKIQIVSEQIAVQPQDRMRIIKMPSEKKYSVNGEKE